MLIATIRAGDPFELVMVMVSVFMAGHGASRVRFPVGFAVMASEGHRVFVSEHG